MRSSFVFALVALASALAGCTPDSAELDVVSTAAEPVVHAADPGAFAVAEGSAVAVEPFMVHEDVEGSSTYSVDDARADDPTILRVAHATRDFDLPGSPVGDEHAIVLLGLTPGTTTLRLYRDNDEVGSIPVEVIAQDP